MRHMRMTTIREVLAPWTRWALNVQENPTKREEIPPWEEEETPAEPGVGHPGNPVDDEVEAAKEMLRRRPYRERRRILTP